MISRLLPALVAATVAAGVLAATGTSAGGHDHMLYGCVYVENLGNSSNLDVITWDKHAPHARGFAMIRGGGLNKTDRFSLDAHGWHISKFNVTQFGDYDFDVALPKLKLEYKFTFSLGSSNDVTSKGCKPH